MEKLESVQYSAALAVTGAWKGTSREKPWQTWLGIPKPTTLGRTPHSFLQDYKQYYPWLLKIPYSDVVGWIRARATRFKNSFYPDCLPEWNTLDPEIRLSLSLNIFKTKLAKLNRPTPKLVYGIHDPKGLAILTQLRVGLRKLNYYKYRHNFQPFVYRKWWGRGHGTFPAALSFV